MTESQSADSYSETEIEIDLGALDSTEAPDTELNLDFGDDDAEAGDDIEIDLAGVDDEPEPVASEPDADGEAALEELRTTLRTQAGDWYVIHTYSGMENRVKQNLDARITTLGMEDYIFESIVPTEDVV